ncbi:unnamed protein product, partial [Protopolystoma xenopodis]
EEDDSEPEWEAAATAGEEEAQRRDDRRDRTLVETHSPPRSGSPTGRLGSPHPSARARSYAGLRLSRAVKLVSRCRAIANIRIIPDTPQTTRNVVTVLHLENEVWS